MTKKEKKDILRITDNLDIKIEELCTKVPSAWTEGREEIRELWAIKTKLELMCL